MQPTMKLSYVERPVDHGECIEFKSTLQQWWEQPPLTPLGIPQPTGEWRDVPIEVES